MTTRQLAKRPRNPARKSPNLREKLSSALLALREARGHAYDRDALKAMPSGEACAGIIAAFEFDHYPQPVALGGTSHPTNLVPRIKADHREKTARVDQPAIAKCARLSKAQETFRAKLLSKGGAEGDGAPQEQKRRSQSRSRYRRRMDGSVIDRLTGARVR